nr:MAG TPA: hypothetical protein [Caudoviricetes sp.]
MAIIELVAFGVLMFKPPVGKRHERMVVVIWLSLSLMSAAASAVYLLATIFLAIL